MEPEKKWAEVAIFTAEDGEAWARFLSNKLSSEAYSIPTHHYPMPITREALVRSRSRKCSRSQDSFSRSTRKISTGSRGGGDTSREDGSGGRSSTGSRSDARDSGTADMSRPGSGQEGDPPTAVCVVLISPAIMDTEDFSSWNLSLLDADITLLVLLGVGQDDLEEMAGEEPALKDLPVLSAEQSPESVKTILVKIIEIYESTDDDDDLDDDDDSPYQTPAQTLRQVNHVHAVLPAQVKRGGEVFVLMDRPAETDLLVCLRDKTPNHLVELGAQVSEKALYHFTLPDHVVGELQVKVTGKGHSYGGGKIRVGPPPEAVYPEESDSPSLSQLLMGLALGAGLKERGAVDASLARQLREQMPPQALQLLQILGNATAHSDKSTQYEWPTLLHFAASEGLEQFTGELLRFPCMLEAALSENRHGDTPFDLATSRGHPRIAQMVKDFVLKHSKDSGIEDEEPPPPSPHRSVATYYNHPREARQNYVDMGASPPREDTSKVQGGSGVSFVNDPPPEAEGEKHPTSPAPLAASPPELGEDRPPAQLPPKKGRRTGLTGERPVLSPISAERAQFLPSGQEPMTPIKEAPTPRMSTEVPVDVPAPSAPAGGTGLSPDLIARLQLVHESAANRPEADDTMSPEEEALMRPRTKRSRSMQEKLSNFFHKISRHRRPRHSEIDTSPDDKPGKTSKQSVKKRGSRLASLKKAVYYLKPGAKRSTQDPNMERDSGSYSDEEGSKESKKTGRKKALKKGRKLNRKQSVRMSRAMQESGADAPTVPSNRR